ncbi:reverse transcriptase [Lithospermum erythrorhizon]|uniref:Reverse transcriptase n=1 Tax=Lithospermum erythrorhizon TaxID=34254 RepID=A0AAV3P5P9_LITER
MAIKLDLDKAFDKLDWGCIYHSLNFFGFPPCITNIIMHCVSSTSMSVIINGNAGIIFQPSRGVRQGDCISPYLFILILELLHLQIETEKDQGNWSPLTFGTSGFSPDCFFADDIILFGKADSKTATSITNTLHQFCSWSGQEISLQKSKIMFSKNTSPSLRSQISNQLQINETNNLGKYLGFPLKVGRQPSSDFNFILDKVRNKLQGWKASSLSLAGRKTLIQATTFAIPNYYCQFTMLPKNICERINKANRAFLWSSSQSKKKIHLVKWSNVTKPTTRGGLGLKSTWEYNKSTMAKLNWRLLKENKLSWGPLIKAKYFNHAPPNLARPRINQFSSVNARNLEKGWDV